MKFKIKINENTTLEDIRKELDELRSANVNEIPFNHLRRIIEFLGAVQVTASGSSVRFEHPALIPHPYYHGYFQIHKIHKGGDQDEVRKIDFKSILYPALITIIDLLENK
jgi:hypothetical protein